MTQQTVAPGAESALELDDDELDAVVGGLSRAFVHDDAPAPDPARVRLPGLTLQGAEPALRT